MAYGPHMPVTNVFAGVPVSDLDTAVAWYGLLVGRPPDLMPNETEAAWQLAGAGWIYVVVDAERAGTALHTVLVDDLDSFVALANGRGVDTGPIEPIGDGVRHVLVADPDGNRLNIGQPPA